MTIEPQVKQALLAAAQQVCDKAYAPFSGFAVGAALLSAQGNIFTGCNVENSSYGLTICAERAAIATAIATEGGEHFKLRAIAIVNASATACSPCGACRQVLLEFGPDAVVWFQNERGWAEATVAALLPQGFRW
ncbi:MAG: cytidine deaminase [Jaaginema sp. PMC 1079.18]|nr:cytidine deaminase [Jaaginema sp. PMC 1080.18]MEC4854066.1 cytidine deaminase [Jaaginema sp. PMC 1079.18]MEC4866281.1 cytidine deaminase [Jaaginema sp. PMC 1078.18]